MASVSSANIGVTIGGDAGPLKAALQDASGSVNSFNKKLGNVAKQAAKMGIAAAAAAATGLAALTKSGLASADAQAKLAAQLRTTSADLAATKRAFDMTGVSQSQLEAGTRSLNTQLGEASMGVGVAKDAFDRMGLSVDVLAKMPLSDRLTAINTAIKEQIPITEQAAVAARIYGARAGAAIMQVSPETIATATKQVENFGAALSEVDAAKIEAANDATSQLKLGFTGITQQLAVQFAPVLQGVADLLADNTGGADTFKLAAAKAFEIAVKGAGYVANAFRGIQVVIKGLELTMLGLKAVVITVMSGVAKIISAYINTVKAEINFLIAGMNKIPGVNISKLVTGQTEASKMWDRWADEAQADVGRVADELHNLLMKPLPSTVLGDFVKDAQAASEAAATAAATGKATNNGLAIPDLPSTTGTDTPAGVDPVKAEQDKADAQNLIWLQQAEAWAKHHEIMNQIQADAGAEQNQLLLWQAQAWDKHYGFMNDIARKAAEEQAAIEAKKAANTQAIQSHANTASAALMKSGSKKMFEIGKAAAIASAIVDGKTAAISSFKAGAKIGGPLLGGAFAAASLLSTGVMIRDLASQSSGSKSAGGGAPAVAQPTLNQGGGQGGGGESSRSSNVAISLHGDSFGRDTVLKLIDQINDAVSDGATVRVV